MSNEEKLELLAEMLEIETDDLTAEMKLEDIDEWDSFARLSFMSLVDENFGKLITSADIKGLQTVADLLSIRNQIKHEFC